MTGAMIVVGGDYLRYPKEIVAVVAILFCFGLRFLGLHFHLNLPSFRHQEMKNDD